MLPTRWLVTCAALFAFASGRSGDGGGPETKLVLYPIVGKGGIITYSTVDPYDPALEAQRRAALWEQQRRDALNAVRQANMRAESMRRQARTEQFRQDQRALWAYEDTRRANVQADLRPQLDRQRWEIAEQSPGRLDSWPGAEATRLRAGVSGPGRRIAPDAATAGRTEPATATGIAALARAMEVRHVRVAASRTLVADCPESRAEVLTTSPGPHVRG
jgi:hypothetical protein